MRRILFLVFVVVLMLSLVACVKTKEDDIFVFAAVLTENDQLLVEAIEVYGIYEETDPIMIEWTLQTMEFMTDLDSLVRYVAELNDFTLNKIRIITGSATLCLGEESFACDIPSSTVDILLAPEHLEDPTLWQYKFEIVVNKKGKTGIYSLHPVIRISEISEIVQNLPPVIPYDPYPADNSEEVDTALTLSWSCSDPEGDGILYDLYFGQNDALVLVATDLATPQYFVDELLFLTSYGWKVVAKDSRGGITEGLLWTFSTGTPEIPTPMPTARSWLNAVTLNGLILVIGGGNLGPLDTLEIYDPVSNSWSIGTPMPTPRACIASSIWNGKTYVFGGHQTFGVSLGIDTLEIYDPETNQWSSGKPMPTARYEHGAVTYGDEIFVIGGVNYGSRMRTLEIYHPETDSWTTGASMPTARSAFAAAELNGKIYVIGGFTGGSRISTVEMYDPVSNTWSTRAPAPRARSEICAAVFGDKIYVFGGILNDYSGPIAIVDIYDPSNDTWTSVSPALIVRSAFTSTVVENHIYLIGGYSYPPRVELNALEVYSLE